MNEKLRAAMQLAKSGNNPNSNQSTPQNLAPVMPLSPTPSTDNHGNSNNANSINANSANNDKPAPTTVIPPQSTLNNATLGELSKAKESQVTEVNEPNKNTAQTPTTQTVAAQTTIAQKSSDKPAPQKPSIAKVDILVAGTPHRIHCPADEVTNLHATVDNINSALRDIRRNLAKNPTNEELLTLHCLELHDEINALKATINELNQTHAQASKVVNDLLKKHSAV